MGVCVWDGSQYVAANVAGIGTSQVQHMAYWDATDGYQVAWPFSFLDHFKRSFIGPYWVPEPGLVSSVMPTLASQNITGNSSAAAFMRTAYKYPARDAKLVALLASNLTNSIYLFICTSENLSGGLPDESIYCAFATTNWYVYARNASDTGATQVATGSYTAGNPSTGDVLAVQRQNNNEIAILVNGVVQGGATTTHNPVLGTSRHAGIMFLKGASTPVVDAVQVADATPVTIGPQTFIDDDFSTNPAPKLDTWSLKPAHSNGTVYAPRNNTTNAVTGVYDTMSPSDDVVVECILSKAGTASVDPVQKSGLNVRTTNNISGPPPVEVTLNFNPSSYQLMTNSPNGAYKTRFSGSWSASVGDKITLKAVGNTYSAYKNDTLVDQWTDTTGQVSPFVGSGTRKVGVKFHNYWSGGWFGSNYSSFGMTQFTAGAL